MSVEQAQRAVNQIDKEIADLEKKMADLVKKEADIAYDYPGNKGSRRVLKAYDDGHAVHITKGQHNAQMRQGIGTNCFVDMPAGTGPLKAGSKVHIWRL